MLQFRNYRRVTPETIGRLTPVQQEQLTLSGKPVYGRDAQTPAETLEMTFAAEEGDEGEAELWEVVENDTPRYDVWIFDVDSAMVFEAGTATDTGVGMIQNYFVEIRTNKPTDLAKALQNAFRNRPNEDAASNSPALSAYRTAIDAVMSAESDNETRAEDAEESTTTRTTKKATAKKSAVKTAATKKSTLKKTAMPSKKKAKKKTSTKKTTTNRKSRNR